MCYNNFKVSALLRFLLELVVRAWKSTVAAMGTTTLYVAVTIVLVPVLVLLLEWASSGFSREGWRSMRSHARANLLVSVVTCGIWLSIFLWHFAVAAPGVIREEAAKIPPPITTRYPSVPGIAYEKTPPHEQHRFTTKELSDFGTGIAVEIGQMTLEGARLSFQPIATGFWISERGYAATCLHLISTYRNSLAAKVPLPPLLGKSLIVAGGSMTTRAEIVAEDNDSDLAILRVYQSPFERSMHGFASATNTKTGETESTHERYWIPAIASKLSRSGDAIVRVGFSSGEIPTVSTDFGHINRAGVDVTKKSSSFRLYTSLPFKQTDCGAPIINEDKKVVGVIAGPDPTSTFMEPREVAIPSMYVLGLLKRANVERR